MLPDYETYKKQHEERKTRLDGEYAKAGYIRVGNQYVKDPNFMTAPEALSYTDRLGDVANEDAQRQAEIDRKNKLTAVIKKNPRLFAELTPDIKADLIAELGTDFDYATATKPKGEKPSDQQVAYSTIQDLIQEVKSAVNEKGDIPGIGAGGTGSLSSMLYNFGINTNDQGENARIAISNIQATLAKLRGGTSFTPNEERLLKRYTPDINDSPKRVTQKVSSLEKLLAGLNQRYGYLEGSPQASSSATAPQKSTSTPDPLGLR